MQAYLSFDGDTAQALAFYARCLGGRVTFSQTFGESPMADQVPPGARGRITHATLEARGHKLMASDTPPAMPFHGHHGFALSVQTADVAEGERLFQALADGGSVTMPYAPTFWSKGFGMLVDRFGVPW